MTQFSLNNMQKWGLNNIIFIHLTFLQGHKILEKKTLYHKWEYTLWTP